MVAARTKAVPRGGRTMEHREAWQTINNWLGQADWRWARNDLWDSFRLQGRISPMHQALSAIFAVVGAAPPVAASVEVDLGEDSYETTGFDATLWTDELVVRALRSGGDDAPVISVMPRASLEGFEVLRAPVVTTSGFESRDDRVELRLTYPDRVLTLTQQRSPNLAELIPSFIRDLRG